jgi:hypothetical protein
VLFHLPVRKLIPFDGVTLLTQAPCSSAPYQEACAYHVPVLESGTRQLAIRLIQTKRGAVLVVPFAS